MKRFKTMGKLLKRIDPRKLNPEDCCFIFHFPSEKRPAVFRIYNRKEGTFTDYQVAGGITPFVQLVSDDVELKEYQDGSKIMDFPEHALTCGKVPLLQPGEIWEAKK